MSLPSASQTASASGQQSLTGAEIHDLRDRGVDDRVAVPRSVWQDAMARARISGLGPTGRSALAALATLLAASGAPERAITHEEIADKTPEEPHPRTVMRAVAAAEAAGYLHVIHRRGGGGVPGRGNIYRLTIPVEHPWAAEWQEDPQADRIDRARGERAWRHQSRQRQAARRRSERHLRQCDTEVTSTPMGLRGEQSSPARARAHEEPSQTSDDSKPEEVGAGDKIERGPGEKSARSTERESSPAQKPAERHDQDLEQVLRGVPARQRAACRSQRTLLAQLRRALKAGWTAAEIRERTLEELGWPSVVFSPGGLVARRIGLLVEQNDPPTRRPRPPVVGEDSGPLDEPTEVVVIDEDHDQEPCSTCGGYGVVEAGANAWANCPECRLESWPEEERGGDPENIADV